MLVGEKNSGNIADKSAAADKSEKIINNVLSREISEAAARELNDFQQIQLSSAELIIDADYQHRTKTIEYEYLDGRNRTRDPRGLIEHIQHFFGKEFTEYSVRTKKRTREIDIGDNFSEYAQRVIELSLDSIEKTVSDEITKLSRETYGRMRTSIEEMYSDIKTAADSLEKLLKATFPKLRAEYARQLAELFQEIRKKCDSSEISTKALDLRGLIAAVHLTEQGLSLGEALEMGILNKSFDDFERQLVSDIVGARIPGELRCGDLFEP